MLMIAVLPFSCAKDEVFHKDGTDGNVILSVGLTVPDPAVRTRAVQYDEQIKEIDVVVFMWTESSNVFREHISVPAGTVADGEHSGSPVKRFDIELDAETVEEGARLLVFANARQLIGDFIAENNISKENRNSREEFYTGLIYSYGWRDGGPFPFDEMIMAGLTDYIFNYPGQTRNLIVTMRQAFTRIDVAVDIDDRYYMRDKFVIEKVWVMGTYKYGYALGNYDTSIAQEYIPAVNERVVDKRHVYDFPESTHIMEQSIYVPESEPLNVTDLYTYTEIDGNGISNTLTDVLPATYPYNGTFLVLKARYEGADRYYRVDFMHPVRGEFLPMLRTRKYIINIISAGYGYTTLEEAMTHTLRLPGRTADAVGLGVEIITER